MPQMSPIMWLTPIMMLMVLLLSIKTGLTTKKESESSTSSKLMKTENKQWKW